MEILKKLMSFMAATIASIFFIALSLGSLGFRSLIFAFVVNWFVMAWIGALALVTNLSLPSTYYVTRSFERTGQVYEHIGIRRVRRLLRRGPLSIFSATLRLPKEKTVPALLNLDNQMRKAEAVHTLAFIFMLVLAGYAAVNGWFDAVTWILLFDILINIYPIMLQRYNRIKLQALIRRLEPPLDLKGTKVTVSMIVQ